MLDPMTIMGGVTIASNLIGGLMGKSASDEAAERAMKIGKLNYAEFMRQADIAGELGSQEVMNLLEAQARHKGTVKGMYGKSGLLMTGTPALAMAEMQEDFDYNVEQAQESVQERVTRLEHSAEMALLGAEARAAGYEEQGRGDLWSAGFGAAKGALQMYSGWGMNKPEVTQPPSPIKMDYGMFNPEMNYINQINTGGLLTDFQYDFG